MVMRKIGQARASFFEKKEAKKLLLLRVVARWCQRLHEQKFFASFFQKRGSCLLPANLLGVLAFTLSPMLTSCAPQQGDSLQQQQAVACGGFGAGMNDTTIGAAGGAAAGGLLGYFAADASGAQNKVAGILLGAAAGGALGASIGSKLDSQDCASLTAELDHTLQYSGDGQSNDWESSKADVHARFVPSHTIYRTQTVRISRAKGVDGVGDLVVIGRIGYAAQQADVLSAPSAGAATLGRLAPGDPLRIVGYSRAAPRYYLIAQRGVAVGYVQAGDTTRRPVDGTVASAPETMAVVAPVRPTPELNGVSGDADADNGIVATARVECRGISTTVSSSAGGATNATTACQTPDGAWNVQKGTNLQDYGAAS
jgi:surface antigen